MKFDSNYRSAQRADYEQFAKFLSGRQNNRADMQNQPYNPCCEHTEVNRRPIAMVYGEAQDWKSIYDVEIALSNGTIFEELNLPLYKTGCSNSQKGCRGI